MALLVWLLKHPKDADTEALYAADEVALVLRVQDRGLDVVAVEGADRVDGVPQRQGDELGPVALVTPEHPGAAVAGGPRVLGEAGLADVIGVSGAVVGAWCAASGLASVVSACHPSLVAAGHPAGPGLNRPLLPPLPAEAAVGSTRPAEVVRTQ